MFKISLEEEKGIQLYKITNTKTGEYVSILHKAGCAINNYVLSKKDGIYIDLIDGYKDEEDFGKNLHTDFKGHFLFPFPNRVYNSVYTFQGKEFQLKKNSLNGESLHGLVYDKEFSVKEYTESEYSGTISFIKEVSGELNEYPFQCTIINTFTYFKRKLSIQSQILNTGDQDMPIGLGWHPYFRTGSDISELFLEIPEAQQWQKELSCFAPVNFFNGENPIKNRFFDSCFKKSKQGNVLLTDIKAGIEILIKTEDDLPYFQIYTPEHRRNIAIEPMSCVPDSFNNKVGLKLLEKDELWMTNWSIEASEYL